MHKGAWILIGLLFLSFSTYSKEKMTLEHLKGLIAAVSQVEEQDANFMQFVYKNVRAALIADQSSDRMRLITPIIKVEQMEVKDLYIVMESNYHQALDARYATSNGVLYSAYIHPLSSLEENQIISALDQVVTLAMTYGTEFTSGALNFGESLVQPNANSTESKKSL